ncbi:MAG: imidazole glycerol phosphate synthase subunit HisH [Gammaproteobacteria bacterium]|nr:imidazole glycerol phosphate synthase subunit HisH [Gammaproteobacteria bacterium]
MIAIIESGGANIASIQFALERLKEPAVLTSDSAIIRAADKVILPGVGAASHAMNKLAELKLIDVIKQLNQPVLGICLGMQLLYEFSEEGNVPGLAIIPGKIQKFPSGIGLTVPHMGWNKLQIKNKSSKLFSDVESEGYVYFVHSYCASVDENTTTVAQYGKPFTASVEKDNFYGVQFHPERSGELGEKILRNFIKL